MDHLQQLVADARARNLEPLLIGGNALRLLGYLRNTIDIDLLVSEADYPSWQKLLEARGYTKFHSTAAFAQFELPEGSDGMPVDLMIVAPETWTKLRSSAEPKALDSQTVAIPCPEHLIALKLHAALSPHRSKPEQDWEDIRQLVRIRNLDPTVDLFRDLILRYGNQESLDRIQSFYDEGHPPNQT